jgi:hypothetical protein
MNEKPLNTIAMDDKTAALFKEFCRLEAQINTLITAGVFDIRDGTAAIYLDKHGVIVSVRADVQLYTSRRELSP